jgi:transcriptional regulator with XRE-family HTH domain
MMPFIADAAKAARKEGGFSHAHIAAARGVRESTIVRFESGQMHRVDLDELLDAYSTVTGLSVIAFWERALAAWRATLSADESSTTTTRRSTTNGASNTRRNERKRARQRA